MLVGLYVVGVVLDVVGVVLNVGVALDVVGVVMGVALGVVVWCWILLVWC